jgi:tripartite-type tricarboxylate transporter receptor subunit TctC
LLATNGAHRSPQAPDVPSVAEFISGFDLSVMQGVFARVGTSTAIVQKIAAEVSTIVNEPEVARQFAAAGIEPVGGSPGDFAAALKGEADRVGRVIQTAGLKAQ